MRYSQVLKINYYYYVQLLLLKCVCTFKYIQGSASSGKSAAVASLAIALGKFLVSITCSPAMDHRAIAKVSLESDDK
jgi:hypothetical protein